MHYVKDFPLLRQLVVDSNTIGNGVHHTYTFVKFDVTGAVDARKRIKELAGVDVSLTGWFLKCVAQAIDENRGIAALRKGKKLVIFDEVDVSMMVESENDGEFFPVFHVVRGANKKTLSEIQEEIDEIKRSGKVNVVDPRQIKRAKRFARLPRFLRLFMWKRIKNNPFFHKERVGTVMVNSVGMFTSREVFGVAPSVVNLHVIIGSIVKEPAVVGDGEIAIRDRVTLTIIANHDILDGTEIIRFIDRLGDFVENAFGLEDLLEDVLLENQRAS